MPAVLTVIVLVVAPVDQSQPPVVVLHVNVSVLPFTRIFVVLLDVTVGTAGGVQVLEVTTLLADVALHPFVPVTVTR